jgi:hypothetical protein
VQEKRWFDGELKFRCHFGTAYNRMQVLEKLKISIKKLPLKTPER